MNGPSKTTGEMMVMSADDKTKIEIVPFGTNEKIQLNVTIVQNMIAVATRTGKKPDSVQCIKFMMLCRARHLNPFEGDAYLLGYDTQNGPQFSLITAHQVFLKRAEASEGFAGMQSGVIVEKDGAVIEREGDLTLTGEKLLGGWAKVYRKNIEYPFYRRLKLETFSTGQSRWAKDGPGMIVKCSEADALRSAFPTHLGGLYIPEEHPPLEAEATVIPRAQISAPAGNGIVSGEEPPPVDKPRGRPRKLKTAAPPNPESPAPEPKQQPKEAGPNAKEVYKRLGESNLTVVDLFQVALLPHHGWVDAPEGYTGDPAQLKDVQLASIGEEKLGVLLEDWQTVVEKIEEMHAAGKGET